jgi:glycosyltransferase involved in cell wall biosynthesis
MKPAEVVNRRSIRMVHLVTLSMIVRNEQANIRPCHQSVSDLVAEIVIADTGSTDRTKEYAAEFGARIVDFPWCDDFAAARNASLEQVSAPWVFWMDADDRLDEENRRQLRTLFASLTDANVGYVMQCVSPWAQRWRS